MIDILAWLTFYVWLKIKGVNFIGKHGLVHNGSFLLELIPLFDSLPVWTAAVIFQVMSVRAENILINKSKK